MRVLILGSGGREHALAWKAAGSEKVEKVFVIPGNAGTALEPKVENVKIDMDNADALVDFAKIEGIGLTIVGPEAPLVTGVVDIFNSSGLPCFGPSRRASQLEGSKAFTKDFLMRHNIPTAWYGTFTELEPAKTYIHKKGVPLVVKADGLAAGKGVIIANSEDEAINVAEGMLSGKNFGDAGRKVIIEQCLSGEEASFIVMTDGKHILPLATSQDHKAAYDGDRGPNTGGMGAYSPAPVVNEAMFNRIMKEVIEPTVEGMAMEGNPYVGFLYAGIMISEDGTPNVLEYNCRFGDPETQPILLRLRSDLVELCLAGIHGGLNEVRAEWDKRASLGIVMAAGGYPGSYSKGHTITGLPDKDSEDVKIFHAGTRLENGKIVTNGGRVLCVTALGDTVSEAQAKAYDVAKKIKWEGAYYRNDIGYRAVGREKDVK